MSSRLAWLGWGLLLVVVLVCAIWFSKVPQVNEIISRIRLRERRAAERIHTGEVKNALHREQVATTTAAAARALAQAQAAKEKADEIAKKRQELAEKLASEIPDAERAQRFRDRHGLSDPRSS